MKIKWRSFSALSKQELYSIMHLRQQVFVVEQNCPFIDADFNDEHCDHMLGYQNNELVAYLRLIKPGIQYQGPSIGRVITIEKIRGQGIGKLITLEAMDFSARKYPEQEITLSAQYRLLSFYEDIPVCRVGCDPAKSIQEDLKKLYDLGKHLDLSPKLMNALENIINNDTGFN